MNLKAGTSPEVGLDGTLTLALWDPQGRTQLSCPRLLTYRTVQYEVGVPCSRCTYSSLWCSSRKLTHWPKDAYHSCIVLGGKCWRKLGHIGWKHSAWPSVKESKKKNVQCRLRGKCRDFHFSHWKRGQQNSERLFQDSLQSSPSVCLSVFDISFPLSHQWWTKAKEKGVWALALGAEREETGNVGCWRRQRGGTSSECRHTHHFLGLQQRKEEKPRESD